MTRLSTTFENALVAWVSGNISGLTAVVWDKQDAPRPPLPYATLNLLPPVKENGAQTFKKWTSTDNFSAQHRYTVAVSVNIISNGDYFAKMQELDMSLDVKSVLADLKTAGLYFRGMSDAVDLTDLLDSSYEFRVQKDFTFAYVATNAEEIEEIQRVIAAFDFGNDIEIDIDVTS